MLYPWWGSSKVSFWKRGFSKAVFEKTSSTARWFFLFLKPFSQNSCTERFFWIFFKGFYKSLFLLLFLKKGRMPKLFQNIVSSPIKPIFPRLGRCSNPDQEQCLSLLREAWYRATHAAASPNVCTNLESILLLRAKTRTSTSLRAMYQDGASTRPKVIWPCLHWL
jgi:hypothetical protein